MGAMYPKLKYLPWFSRSYRFKFFEIASNMKAHGNLIHTLFLFGDGIWESNKNVSLFFPF